MKLEVGKEYRTRCGFKVTNVRGASGWMNCSFVAYVDGKDRLYYADGKHGAKYTENIPELDIVAEWVEPGENVDRAQVAALSSGEPDDRPEDSFEDDGYDALRGVLADAAEQASSGKGRERHANGKPFDRQPIMEIGRMLSSVCDGELYQAIKKSQEASGMISRGDFDAAERELLGGINYLAAAILLIREAASK